jgi:hypothetical protein
MLALLAFDGVLSAVAGVLFLPMFIGAVPLPISALISGLLNAGLVWAALQWTANTRLAALPLWAFLATVLLLTFGGPGSDMMFDGLAGAVVMVLFGAAPPALVLWRRVGQVG